jgi:hypothetical protein
VNGPGVGHATVSNAFPTDLVGTFGTPPASHPDITSVTPSTIEALIPGTDHTVTITGTNLDLTTDILYDGLPIDPARFTIVDPSTITLDMQQAAALGALNLGVTDGSTIDEFPVTIVVPATPKLQWGTGDPGNLIDRSFGMDIIISGQVGTAHSVRGSPNGPPKLNRYIRPVDMVLIDAGTYVIPPEGWILIHIADLPDPAEVGATWFARSFELTPPKPFPSSNDQSITLVP